MAILMRHKSTIFGLETDLLDINNAITAEANTRAENDGDLTALSTTAKGDLVSAINEVFAGVAAGNDSALQKAANLSDLTDIAAARTNIDVYSTTEVDNAITAASLAMGTNYDVADIAARDALTGLDVADRVFVGDDGDGKWSLYKVSAVDENGVGTAFTKLMDQDALENSISAESIKASYESNADTNAFTDAEQTKVGFITVTEAIDLDDAVVKAELEQDLSVSAPSTNAPSAAAVVAYADEAARLGGSSTAIESLVVTTGEITLTDEPKDGLASIMNFATIRYTDTNGVSYDAPVVATADPKVFTVSTDSAGQWDGNTVQVQYVFVPGSDGEVSGGGAI